MLLGHLWFLRVSTCSNCKIVFHMPTYKGFSILLSEICATDLWTLVFMTWKENLPLMPDLVYECIVRKDYRIINSVSTERMSSNPRSTIKDKQQKTYILTLDLSSFVLEIPNNSYTTLGQFWLAVQHSVKSTASWLVDVGKKWEGNFEH